MGDGAAERFKGFEGVDVGNRLRVQLVPVDVAKGHIDFKKVGWVFARRPAHGPGSSGLSTGRDARCPATGRYA
jgi:hypothetical protein